MAAGLGKRMRSKLAKVLHPVLGRPMILYAVDLAERVAGRGVLVVVGHQGDRVKSLIETRKGGDATTHAVTVVEQGEQRGTGHAVMQARSAFMRDRRDPAAACLIMNGDTPLLTEATVRRLWEVHQAQQATLTVLTTVLDDPSGYGRVVRAGDSYEGAGAVLRIVEDRDASTMEARLQEVNVGTYIVDGPFLFEALDKLAPKNVQKEYYLTDLVGIAVERGLRVSAVAVGSPQEGLGINTRQQLAAAERALRDHVRQKWMTAGVTLQDPATTWIDADVIIGQDTVLYPHVTLEGATNIGEDCVVHSHVRLTDCGLGDRVTVLDSCVLKGATVDEDAVVGPFAHLRPGAVVRRRAKVGNFVEMKQAELGEGSKANHLTYLGDSRIGQKVNIGAGTITCNYDGVSKYETIVEDDVFVGSNALLIAPVRVGRGALIAAGSVVTQDVPPEALAIARATQMNRPGWATRRRALNPKKGVRAARGGTDIKKVARQKTKGKGKA